VDNVDATCLAETVSREREQSNMGPINNPKPTSKISLRLLPNSRVA